jgi:hypothetical protein
MGLLAVACCVMTARAAFPGDAEQTASGQTQATSSPAPGAKAATAAGMTIHVDPQTGALLKEPAPGTVPLHLTPPLANSLSTSDQGLVEVPSSVPGGGVRMDLQGRFRSPLLATTDAHGKLKILHLQEMPESGFRE